MIRDEKNNQYVLFFKDEGRSVDNNGWRTRQGVMREPPQPISPVRGRWSGGICRSRDSFLLREAVSSHLLMAANGY